MNMKDAIPIGKPRRVPIGEKGKPLDYNKEISAEDMIKSVSYERILKSIMHIEKDFVFNYIKMDIKEIEKNKVFHCKYYYTEEKYVEDNVIVEDELEGKKWHKMVKEPQNVVCIMIAKRISDDDWDCSYISGYNRGSNSKTAMELFTKLIQSFMDWKDVKTIRKMLDYVENAEKVVNSRNEFLYRYGQERK